MKYLFPLFFFFLLTGYVNGQSVASDSSSVEDDIVFAYKNAMRGVIWAIDNIPYKKDATYKDIIESNKKICSLKIFKQEGGIKIISIGYFNSSSVEITTYYSIPEKFR